jgi:DNA polymerase
MGRVYGVHLPEADARRTVNAWRQANPWAVRYWQALESAYMRAMRNKGKEFTAGRVTYLFDGVHLWYALPSGRVLCYPHARFETDGVSYAKCAWKPAQDATEWPRARLWSGLAAENICQAVANDLLRHSLRQVDDVVLTIHDEILLECPIEKVHDAMENLKRIMCTPPDWCKELPLSVDIKIMSRYGK